MKSKNIIIYVLALVFIFQLPFVFRGCFLSHKEPTTIAFDLVRTACIVTGAFLALLYFDPLSIRKKRIEKQHENVIAVLEKLTGTKTNIWGYRFEDGVRQFEFSRPRYLSKSQLEEVLKKGDRRVDWEVTLNRPVWMDFEEYTETFESLFKLQSSIWTPAEIASAIAVVNFGSALGIGDTKEEHVMLRWIRDYKHQLICHRFRNDEIITLRMFLSGYKNIIDQCETWLKKNSFFSEGLNI